MTGSPGRSRCPTTRVRRARHRHRCSGGHSTLPAAPVERAAVRHGAGPPRVAINGRPVSRRPPRAGLDGLSPSSPRRDLRRDRLLRAGRNVIARDAGRRLVSRPPRLGSRRMTAARTAARSALFAQLEVRPRRTARAVGRRDGRRRGARRPARSGPLTCTTGATIDLRERRTGWDAARLRRRGLGSRSRRARVDAPIVEPRIAPPVRVVGVRPVTPAGSRTRTAARSTAVRTSPATCGYACGARPATVVTVRHAEVLEPDGSLHTALAALGAGDRHLRARRRPGDGPRAAVHVPRLSLRGDRDRCGRPRRDASWRSAATRPARLTFECCHAELNRLHENVVWSQRDNFVSVPTDCPQRDERLGWTGDAQAFASTARTLFDAQSFWASWLRDLALDQDAGAGRAVRRPGCRARGRGAVRASRLGGRGHHRALGRLRGLWRRHVLRDQFESMRDWVDSLRSTRRGPMACCPSACSSATGWIPTRRRPALGGQGRLRPTWRTPSSRTARASRPRGLAPRGPTGRGSTTTRCAETSRPRPGRAGASTPLTTQTGCAVALVLGLVPPSERAASATPSPRSCARPRAASRRGSSARRSCCPRSPRRVTSRRPT